MNVYLAGPMRGIKDFNFPRFHAAAKRLREQGHTVFNPAERDEERYGKDISESPSGHLQDAAQKGFNLREALSADLAWICAEADAIAMLPGWMKSRGATAELATAKALGLHIFYLSEEGA